MLLYIHILDLFFSNSSQVVDQVIIDVYPDYQKHVNSNFHMKFSLIVNISLIVSVSANKLIKSFWVQCMLRDQDQMF